MFARSAVFYLKKIQLILKLCHVTIITVSLKEIKDVAHLRRLIWSTSCHKYRLFPNLIVVKITISQSPIGFSRPLIQRPYTAKNAQLGGIGGSPLHQRLPNPHLAPQSNRNQRHNFGQEGPNFATEDAVLEYLSKIF